MQLPEKLLSFFPGILSRIERASSGDLTPSGSTAEEFDSTFHSIHTKAQADIDSCAEHGFGAASPTTPDGSATIDSSGYSQKQGSFVAFGHPMSSIFPAQYVDAGMNLLGKVPVNEMVMTGTYENPEYAESVMTLGSFTHELRSVVPFQTLAVTPPTKSDAGVVVSIPTDELTQDSMEALAALLAKYGVATTGFTGESDADVRVAESDTETQPSVSEKTLILGVHLPVMNAPHRAENSPLAESDAESYDESVSPTSSNRFDYTVDHVKNAGHNESSETGSVALNSTEHQRNTYTGGSLAENVSRATRSRGINGLRGDDESASKMIMQDAPSVSVHGTAGGKSTATFGMLDEQLMSGVQSIQSRISGNGGIKSADVTADVTAAASSLDELHESVRGNMMLPSSAAQAFPANELRNGDAVEGLDRKEPVLETGHSSDVKSAAHAEAASVNPMNKKVDDYSANVDEHVGALDALSKRMLAVPTKGRDTDASKEKNTQARLQSRDSGKARLVIEVHSDNEGAVSLRGGESVGRRDSAVAPVFAHDARFQSAVFDTNEKPHDSVSKLHDAHAIEKMPAASFDGGDVQARTAGMSIVPTSTPEMRGVVRPSGFVGSETGARVFRVTMERFVPQTSSIISNLAEQSESVAKLIITPESLGTIVVNMKLQEQQNSLHLEVTNAVTRDLVQANIGILREQCASQGVRLENVSVTVREQDSSPGRYDHGNQQSRNHRREDSDARSTFVRSGIREDSRGMNREESNRSNRDPRQNQRRRQAGDSNFERYA